MKIARLLLRGPTGTGANAQSAGLSKTFAIQLRTFVVLTLATSALQLVAKPRPPLPPLPEMGLSFRADFDEPFWSRTEKPESFNAAYTDLVESWSGYALRRAGKPVTPFFVPALDQLGHTNVNCSEGAVRCWFNPFWSSATIPNGTGPGTSGQLIELSIIDGKNAVPVWSINVSPDGTTLLLTAVTETGAKDLLQAPIDWLAGQWHLVSLNYGPKSTTLSIDGKLAAEGDGTLPVPAKIAALSVGSDLAGSDVAGGEFDEVCAFGRPLLTPFEDFYYGALSQRTTLGPITPEEEAAQRELAIKRKAERDAEGGGQQYRMLAQSLTNCPTNAVIWLTNITRVLTTNLDVTVTFDLVGGDSTLLYDLFATTNIFTTNCLSCTNFTNHLYESAWVWLERGPSCAKYQYTNQTQWFAFYIAGTPLDSDGDGLTDAYERLVSKTAVNASDTDQDGVSDLDEVVQGRNPAQTSGQKGWRPDDSPQKVRLETVVPRR